MDTPDEIRAADRAFAEHCAAIARGETSAYSEPEPEPITVADVMRQAQTYGTLKAVAMDTGSFGRSDRAAAELRTLIATFGKQCADSGEVAA